MIYSAGPTFKFHPQRKSWEEAEEACIEEGGHLASVRSLNEVKELLALDVGSTDKVWIGGTLDSAGNCFLLQQQTYGKSKTTLA